MNEKQMRAAKVPTFNSMEQLVKYITKLEKQKHDYGTCVYAMSMAATATFNYMANMLGVTGFQASCADMDIVRRVRGWERFYLMNLNDLLYPQYCNNENFKNYEKLLEENGEWLSKEAKKRLKEEKGNLAHPNVIAHWKMLAKMKAKKNENNPV